LLEAVSQKYITKQQSQQIIKFRNNPSNSDWMFK
jgi:hypothetical protein